MNKKIKGPSEKKSRSHLIKDAGSSMNYDKSRPVFSFSDIDKKYCCLKKDCNASEKGHFLGKILELSELTWQSIKDAPRKGAGFELIPKEQLKTDVLSNYPAERLMVFRLTDKMRMLGVRDKEKFTILLIDPAHGAY